MIEAIVALGIIMTAVSAALTLTATVVRASKESESSIVATNLAREGVEVARGLRDSNWLAETAWDSGLLDVGRPTDCTAIPVFAPDDQVHGFWSLDFSADQISDAVAVVYRQTGGEEPLAPGLFVQAAAAPANAVPSGFRRLMTLKSVCRNKTLSAGDGTVSLTCGDCGSAYAKIGVQVSVEVQWAGTGGTRSLKNEEIFYNWR